MAEKKNEKKLPFPMYRGKPLVRNGNTLYYGDMSDEYVIMMQILSTQEFDGEEIAQKVLVQLMLTDPEVRPKKRIVKKSEQDGLYNALDISYIWLTRALKPKEAPAQQ